ncbi:unnamed protein product, partial [Polarella glacialis]
MPCHPQRSRRARTGVCTTAAVLALASLGCGAHIRCRQGLAAACVRPIALPSQLLTGRPTNEGFLPDDQDSLPGPRRAQSLGRRESLGAVSSSLAALSLAEISLPAAAEDAAPPIPPRGWQLKLPEDWVKSKQAAVPGPEERRTKELLLAGNAAQDAEVSREQILPASPHFKLGISACDLLADYGWPGAGKGGQKYLMYEFDLTRCEGAQVEGIKGKVCQKTISLPVIVLSDVARILHPDSMFTRSFELGKAEFEHTQLGLFPVFAVLLAAKGAASAEFVSDMGCEEGSLLQMKLTPPVRIIRRETTAPSTDSGNSMWVPGPVALKSILPLDITSLKENGADLVTLKVLQGIVAASQGAQLYLYLPGKQVNKDGSGYFPTNADEAKGLVNDMLFWLSVLKETYPVNDTFASNHTLATVCTYFQDLVRGYTTYDSSKYTDAAEAVDVATTFGGIEKLLPFEEGSKSVEAVVKAFKLLHIDLPYKPCPSSYQDLANTYGHSGSDQLDENFALELQANAGFVQGPRDYAAMLHGFVYYGSSARSVAFDTILSNSTRPAYFLGWNANGGGEGGYVSDVSKRGDVVLASDNSINLALFSSSRTVAVKANAKLPSDHGYVLDPKKVYVSFIVSDGDNLQLVTNKANSEQWWGSPYRGKFPIGWTMPPAMMDLEPDVWNYFATSQTDQDELMVGPSGIGYAFEDVLENPDKFDQQLRQLDAFMNRSGLMTVSAFTNNAPSGQNPAQDFLQAIARVERVRGVFWCEFNPWQGQAPTRSPAGTAYSLEGARKVLLAPQTIYMRKDRYSADVYVTTTAAQLNGIADSPGADQSDRPQFFSVYAQRNDLDKTMEYLNNFKSQLNDNVVVVAPYVAADLIAKVIDNLPSLLREVAALYREVGDLTEEESILKDIMGYQLGRGAKNEVSKMEAEIRDLFAAKKQEVPAALLRIAAVHYASGGAERARLLAEEAVEAAATLGDQATQGLALLACAAVHLSQQKLDDAVKAVERAVQLQDDKRQKASGYYAIAQISISMEKGLSEALAALKTARALMQEAGDKAREIEILQIVTELHLGRQEAAEAMSAGREALAVSQAFGDKKLEAGSLQLLASANLARSNESEALRLAEEALSKAREAGDTGLEAEASNSIANIFLSRGDQKAAAAKSRELLTICRERQNLPGEASAMVVLGNAILADNKRSSEGLQYLQAACSIYDELGDVYGMHSAHFSLANSFFIRGDLEDGLRHAREVLACCRRTGDKVNEDFMKQNIERARQMAAEQRRQEPKRLSVEGASILAGPAGPQACAIKGSRVPGSLLEIAAAGRRYWGVPRQVQDAAAEVDERPPSHCIVWGHSMSDNSPTQNCLELMALAGAMAKGDIAKIPILVQTCGVHGRLVGDMATASQSMVSA